MANKWLNEKNKAKFVKFKHTSPFILHLFEFVNAIILSKQENTKEQELDTIMKYLHLIYVFSFNNINLLLIDKVRGPQFLMNCLMSYTQELDVKDTLGWQKIGAFVDAVLRCVYSTLRL